MSEKIKCFKFMHGNSGGLILSVDEDAMSAISLLVFGETPVENVEIGDKYQLEIIEMTQEELDNLPEWGGF